MKEKTIGWIVIIAITVFLTSIVSYVIWDVSNIESIIVDDTVIDAKLSKEGFLEIFFENKTTNSTYSYTVKLSGLDWQIDLTEHSRTILHLSRHQGEDIWRIERIIKVP